jgi:hypothetical protein
MQKTKTENALGILFHVGRERLSGRVTLEQRGKAREGVRR